MLGLTRWLGREKVLATKPSSLTLRTLMEEGRTDFQGDFQTREYSLMLTHVLIT